MIISLVAAMGCNMVIGRGNKLPWVKIPADLHRFRETTFGKPVVMGRKTHETLGKPLSGRLNLVLTRNRNYEAKDCLMFHSVKDVFDVLAGFEEVMVIGGGEVFQQFLPYASRIYLTVVGLKFAGDVYFPAVNWSRDWTTVKRDDIRKGKDTPYDLTFSVLKRIGPARPKP